MVTGVDSSTCAVVELYDPDTVAIGLNSGLMAAGTPSSCRYTLGELDDTAVPDTVTCSVPLAVTFGS
jgi:hypothetical protein